MNFCQTGQLLSERHGVLSGWAVTPRRACISLTRCSYSKKGMKFSEAWRLLPEGYGVLSDKVKLLPEGYQVSQAWRLLPEGHGVLPGMAVTPRRV